jgi:molybdopterin synthase sulfur carrier subunit
MKVHIKYFASIRESLGVASESLETGAADLAGLRDALTQRKGGEVLARGRAVRMALNQVMCEEHAALTEGCEVAFFPPVTGG